MSDAVLPVEVDAPGDATLPKRVSYSQMSLYQQCPLKFYFSHVAGWKEPQTAQLTGGNVAHDIVERLYRLPPEERTLERARELLREFGPRMLRKPEYVAFENDNAMKQSVLDAVQNLFEVEHPPSVVVAPEHIEMELNTEINGVHFFGRVDRFTIEGANRVTDYKTGKGPGKFVDDKLRQVYLYALAFKMQYDIDVDEVELLYLNAREVVRRPADQARMTAMGEDLAAMHTASVHDLSQGIWAARPQRLCDYCSYQQACPARNVAAPKPGTSECESILLGNGLAKR